MLPNQETLSQRIVSPADCVLAFGIPTTKDEFEKSLRQKNRDYSKQFMGGWHQYERTFVSHLALYTQRYSARGVKVVTDLQSTDFAMLFEHNPVVTLFTHWTPDGIELCDGILSTLDVIEDIPLEFSGVLDLCVCHPQRLVDILPHERQLCSVHYIARKASPLFWLIFYDAFYGVLSLGGRNYSDTLKDVTGGLRE